MRKVIVHYHLFKNAGTSVDHSLKTCFGDDWQQLEGVNPVTPEQLQKFFTDNPSVVALSSHTARLPLPECSNFRVFPILFLRHPIDRIRSVYDFERRQCAETYGANLAKKTDLRGYIEARLDRPGDFSLQNFQARRLAGPVDRRSVDSNALWEQTLSMFTKLPLVGLVEHFSDSMRVYQRVLEPHFPSLILEHIKLNNTTCVSPRLEERLESVLTALGQTLYHELEQQNALDLSLYELARTRMRNFRAD